MLWYALACIHSKLVEVHALDASHVKSVLCPQAQQTAATPHQGRPAARKAISTEMIDSMDVERPCFDARRNGEVLLVVDFVQ